MAEFKRVRHGHLPTRAGDYIKVGDDMFHVDDYADVLTKQKQSIKLSLIQEKGSEKSLFDRAIKAATCGRVVAKAHGNASIFEVCKYCRQREWCTACYKWKRALAAKDSVSDLGSLSGMRVLQFLFTHVRPYNSTDELVYLQLAAATLEHLRKTLTNWQRRQGSQHQIAAYSIGMHLRRDVDSTYHWPHIHMCVVASHLCPTRGKASLHTYLQHAFTEAIDEIGGAKVQQDNLGILSGSKLTESKRKKAKKGKRCSYIRLTNSLSYATRITELDDTPEDTADRKLLLLRANIGQTFINSRRSSESKERHRTSSLPDEFCPIALKKQLALVFPIDGSPCREIPVDSWRIELAKLKANARVEFLKLFR